MAHTLSPWFQEDYKDKFIDRISYLAKKGKTVNILILKPYGKNLASMDVGNIDDYSKKIEKSLTKLRVLYLELPAEAKKYVHIKLNGKYNMPYTYIRNECQTYISPYLFSGKGRSNFIMALDTTSDFAKNFQQDFIDMFEEKNMSSIYEPMLCYETHSENCKYTASNWVTEDTHKYVFDDLGKKYEAGYFVHYDKDGQVVDRTIELPSSYGCPYKCRYCASSLIPDFSKASSDIMLSIVSQIIYAHKLSDRDAIHISFTGTGDYSYSYQNIARFINKAKLSYPQFYYTISSCAWTPKLLQEVDNLDITSRLKNIQITYIASTIPEIEEYIPNFPSTVSYPQLSELLIKKPYKDKIRVNYIMIKGVNDTEAAFDTFCKNFELLKDVITVRISRLNETLSTKEYALYPPDSTSLENMRSACIKMDILMCIYSALVKMIT